MTTGAQEPGGAWRRVWRVTEYVENRGCGRQLGTQVVKLNTGWRVGRF